MLGQWNRVEEREQDNPALVMQVSGGTMIKTTGGMIVSSRVLKNAV